MANPDEQTTQKNDDFDFLEDVNDDYSNDDFVDNQASIDADNDCGDSCKI
ncbi:hypothetical protein MIB92_15280 [Aestuariirhabdus sp. Z084]|nr:hypothetical protein [Aestuariirhabdus haliotis]MCL6417022.1 hypothetical protein [Aestuariirhabdus haliotis]MCL6421055.1 hypothetical protein [Aestuariirhabdus haliotis]